MTLAWMIVMIIIIGLISSMLASILGLGGGLVAIPLILLVVGGQSPNVAKLISYVNLVFITLISAIKYYTLKRKPNWSNAFLILLGVIPSTILASIYITPLFNDNSYKPYFHIAYVVVAIFTTILIANKDKIKIKKPSNFMIVCAGMIIGVLSGSIGLSGGILFIPVLVIGMKMSLKKAAVTSLILKLFTSMANVIANVITGEFNKNFGNITTYNDGKIPWIVILVILIGSFIGSQIGPIINNKITDKIMHRLFYAVMAIIISWESTQAIFSLTTGATII